MSIEGGYFRGTLPNKGGTFRGISEKQGAILGEIFVRTGAFLTHTRVTLIYSSAPPEKIASHI